MMQRQQHSLQWQECQSAAATFLKIQVNTWRRLSPAKLECRLCVGFAGFPCVLAGMGPMLELMRHEITPAMASIHSRASSSSSAFT